MDVVNLPSFIPDPSQLSATERFYLSAMRGNAPLLIELLEAEGGEINYNVVDDNGYTALHQAAVHGYAGIIKILLNYDKVGFNILDKLGRHVIEIAWKKGDESILEILYKKLAELIQHDPSILATNSFVRIICSSREDIFGNSVDMSKINEMKVEENKVMALAAYSKRE